MPMIRGHAGGLHAKNAGARGQAVVLGTFLLSQHAAHSAVIHAGCITGRHVTRSCGRGARSLARPSSVVPSTRMLVHSTTIRVALAALDRRPDDFLGQAAILLGLQRRIIWER